MCGLGFQSWRWSGSPSQKRDGTPCLSGAVDPAFRSNENVSAKRKMQCAAVFDHLPPSPSVSLGFLAAIETLRERCIASHLQAEASLDGPAVLLRPRHTRPLSRILKELFALRHEPNLGEARTIRRRRNALHSHLIRQAHRRSPTAWLSGFAWCPRAQSLACTVMARRRPTVRLLHSPLRVPNPLRLY